jgi:hypothetical protein
MHNPVVLFLCVCVAAVSVAQQFLHGTNMPLYHDMNEKQVRTYDNSLSTIIYNEPSVSGYQGDCEMFPGTEHLTRNIKQI